MPLKSPELAPSFFTLSSTEGSVGFLGRIKQSVDWLLFAATIPILAAGLVTMNSFVGENYYAGRQVIWIAISLSIFFIFSSVDWRFLRRSGVLVILYFLALIFLSLLAFAPETRGVQSWFKFGSLSLQPVDFMKLVLILMLAKYFSRRHIEIAHWKHILISGTYALIPFLLVLLQPDFGSAMILFLIWLGQILVSGVSRKHLLLIFLLVLLVSTIFWFFIFAPYQKARIVTFLHPLADVRGAGYNAFQSTVAIGSGKITGKGVGFGTQSRLEFLPEYQTDFIFAAFAEEWGFIGVLILFICYGTIVWRILTASLRGATNFEILFGTGMAIFIMSHFTINVGMNMGLLPVTGITLPFMSYGGSHLLSLFMGLGILMGMRQYSRGFHKEDTRKEFLGLE